MKKIYILVFTIISGVVFAQDVKPNKKKPNTINSLKSSTVNNSITVEKKDKSEKNKSVDKSCCPSKATSFSDIIEAERKK